MSKSKKGMLCVLAEWEVENSRNGIPIDCRNHRHISRGRAFERTGNARFADQTLALVVDSQYGLIGHIVEVAGRARWASPPGTDGKVRPYHFPPDCWIIINAHLKQFQSLLDAKRQTPTIVQLDRTIINRPLPRQVAICEALRSYSPSSLTAHDSELIAGSRSYPLEHRKHRKH